MDPIEDVDCGLETARAVASERRSHLAALYWIVAMLLVILALGVGGAFLLIARSNVFVVPSAVVPPALEARPASVPRKQFLKFSRSSAISAGFGVSSRTVTTPARVCDVVRARRVQS